MRNRTRIRLSTTLVTLMVLTIAHKIQAKGVGKKKASKSMLYNDKKCKAALKNSPANLSGKMDYKEFTVDSNLKTTKNIVINKLENSAYELTADDFGDFKYNGARYKVLRAIMKSPSDHKINGNYHPLELQISTLGPQGRMIISKLFKSTNGFAPGQQHGLSKFHFGTGKYAELDPKISTDDQLELIMNDMADQVPKFSADVKEKLSLEPLFQGDKHFMMYKGHETFGDCEEAIWMVSLDFAYVSKLELSDFDTSAKPDFVAREIQGKVPIYQNRDKKDKPKPKPKPKAKPAAKPKPKAKPKAPAHPPHKKPAAPPKAKPQPPATPKPPPITKMPPPKPQAPKKPAPAAKKSPKAPPVAELPVLKNPEDKAKPPAELPHAAPPAPRGPPASKKSDPTDPGAAADPGKAEEEEKEKKHKKKLKNMYKFKPHNKKKKKDDGDKEKDDDEEEEEEDDDKEDDDKNNDDDEEEEEEDDDEESDQEEEQKYKDYPKFEIYSPNIGEIYGTIPKDCVRPWEASKARKEGKNIRRHNERYFPETDGTMWTTVFYYPAKKGVNYWIPHIVKVSQNAKIEKKFEKLGVFNPFTNNYDQIVFTKDPKKAKKVKITLKKKEKKPEPPKPKKHKYRRGPLHFISFNFGHHKMKLVKPKLVIPQVKPEKEETPDSELLVSSNPNDRDRHYLFDSCQEGLEMATSVPKSESYEIRKQLAERCNIDFGGRVKKIVPLFGEINHRLGNFFGSFLHKRGGSPPPNLEQLAQEDSQFVDDGDEDDDQIVM